MPSVIRGDDNFDSGNVGSTTTGGVGTYTTGFLPTGTTTGDSYLGGETVSGSSLLAYDAFGNSYPFQPSLLSTGIVSAGLSGTWRLMSYKLSRSENNTHVNGLWLRIS